MTKILFPTDFSDTANNAFLYALNLAKVLNAEIRLISVQSSVKNYLDVTEDDFESYINQLKDIATANGLEDINIESSLVIGDLLMMILDIVNKQDISYIVMGTNGQNSLGKKFFGSNTLNVLNNATVPVMIVPNKVKFKKERNFAFATLFNETENKALAQMDEIVNRYNKQLKLVHVETKVVTTEIQKKKKRCQES